MNNYLCNESLFSDLYDIMNDCNNKCPSECHTQKFDIDMDTIPNIECESDVSADDIIIYLRHSNTQETFEEFLPKYNWETVFGNCGGIMGIWIGISIFGIIHSIISLKKKILELLNNN